MNSKEALTELFNEANRFSFKSPKYTSEELWQMCKQIQDDLEILDSLLDIFANDIFNAFDPYYRNGDNIITDDLIKQLGMSTLKKIAKRVK